MYSMNIRITEDNEEMVENGYDMILFTFPCEIMESSRSEILLKNQDCKLTFDGFNIHFTSEDYLKLFDYLKTIKSSSHNYISDKGQIILSNDTGSIYEENLLSALNAERLTLFLKDKCLVQAKK